MGDDGWDEAPAATSGFGGGFGAASGGGGDTCRYCKQEGHMIKDCPTKPQRSSGCFKCGEEGHMSRECPSGGGGGGSRACYKCGEEGHMSRECPSGGSGGGSRACFKCGEEGHMSRECPSGGSGGGGGSRACFKCGEEGHMSRECPSGGGGGGSRACFKCGEEGHMSRECPSGGGGGGGGSRACFKCGEEGHMSRDCPSQGGGGGSSEGGGFSFGGGFGGNAEGASKSNSACRNCGEEGHFARECPTKSDNDNKCRYCKEEGHMVRDCPTRPAQDDDNKCRYCKEEGHLIRDCPTKPADDGKCRRCGNEGHFSRDCTVIPEGKPGIDGKPPPVTYVPEVDESEETLFRRGCNAGINFDKYDSIDVEVSGPEADKDKLKINSFAEAGLFEQTFANVQKSGYKKPTPIQKYAIPIVASGRDLMACAQTGSGKTAAFLLPIITGILKSNALSSGYSAKQEPAALVVAPTRELAVQTHLEAVKFCMGTMVNAVVAYGGVATSSQMGRLEKGCDILIATPGRLLDFVERGKVGLGKIKYFVLDEADRMLDMGFEPAIRKIEAAGMTPKEERQTLMFSATFPNAIQRLASEFMKSYIFVTVGIVGGANSDVDQTILQVTQFDKREKLVEVLRSVAGERTLVFVGQKRNADFIASYLSQTGFSTTSIHGDRMQREREQALRDFRSKTCEVLIATNVAARGLDIPNVELVINFDLPSEIDEYVHRIGRSGRCGNVGRALTFFDPNEAEDQKMARPLVTQLMNCEMEVPQWLQDIASGALAGGGGGEGGRRDARGRKNVIRDNAVDGDDWEDGGGAAGGDAGGGGKGFGDAGGDDDDWD